jgi:hypothetical protein
MDLVVEKMGQKDCEVYCQPWTTRMPKAAQPNLNYIGKISVTKTTFTYGVKFNFSDAIFTVG